MLAIGPSSVWTLPGVMKAYSFGSNSMTSLGRVVSELRALSHSFEEGEMNLRRLQFCQRLAAVLLLFGSSPLEAKKFYSDDPLLKEPKPLHVDDVTFLRLSQYFDFFHHTLATPGDLNAKKREKHQEVV